MCGRCPPLSGPSSTVVSVCVIPVYGQPFKFLSGRRVVDDGGVVGGDGVGDDGVVGGDSAVVMTSAVCLNVCIVL